ncbi:MAG TPA: hypothetical protein VM425_08340 [Myxococcota bacterium]|nr:hypothetical protein [Myxococcota bacterium]
MKKLCYTGRSLWPGPTAALVVCALLAWSGMASAADDEQAGDEQQQSSKYDPFLSSATKAPWRGSQLIYSNTFNLISLDRSAELTYNPNYSMTWSFRPRWWFGDNFFVRATLDVTRELTEADETTYSREAWLGDLSLVAGVAKLWTVPLVGVDISGDIGLTFPTSKASQAATLVMAVAPRLRLSKTFNLLKAFIVGANLRVTPYFHRYTTRELESPLIANCSANEAGCGAFLNSGSRNAFLRLTPSLDATQVIFDWLGVSLSYGWLIDWLHATNGGEDVVSYQPQQPQDQRYYSFFQLNVFFEPASFVEVDLNLLTYAPQLAPDSNYYNPFFNRYTTFSVDLIIRVDGLIGLLGGK